MQISRQTRGALGVGCWSIGPEGLDMHYINIRIPLKRRWQLRKDLLMYILIRPVFMELQRPASRYMSEGFERCMMQVICAEFMKRCTGRRYQRAMDRLPAEFHLHSALMCLHLRQHAAAADSPPLPPPTRRCPARAATSMLRTTILSARLPCILSPFFCGSSHLLPILDILSSS